MGIGCLMDRKKQFVNMLCVGDSIDDVFVLAEKSLGRKKNGDSFLSFGFADRTGDIKGVAWDNVEEINGAAASGAFVRVTGAVSEFRGGLQLTVRGLVCCDTDTVDPADFLPVTTRNPDRMFDRLKRTVDECIRDPHIKRLMEAFWADEAFVRRFKTAPAAKKMHHAYIGGLLEHTLSMTVLAKEIAKHYSGVNLDLLLAGAVLHDIGKTREFEYQFAIGYSDEGKLLTHIVIGCAMIDDKIRELAGFPPETAMLVKHMVVSHHGSREFGSPEPPKLMEAVLLNQIDDIDAKMNGIREFMAGEDPNETWTSYNRMLGRQLYRGKPPEEPSE